MDKEKLSIRVSVADRYYPLKVDRNDEEKIRKAAKLINEKILQYKSRYNDKDNQDFLAMAALQFVTRLIEFEGKSDATHLVERIKELNRELGDFLKMESQYNVL